MALILAPGAWATADGVVILGGGGGGAAATLAATLLVGNTTGGTGIEVSAADPILLNENATVPGGAPGAAKGTVWVRSDTPNVLVYTDDAGTDTVLGTAHPGDVIGPGASTDEAVARFDLATGKLLQNSVLLVTDAGAVSGATTYNGVTVETHATRHENGGADEISVLGLSGLLADAQTPVPTAGADTTAIHDNVAGEIAAIANKAVPVGGDFIVIEDSAAANVKKHILVSALPAAAPAAHASSHENGGGDEISVLGLSGLLADAQTPVPTAGADTTAIHDNVAGEIAAIANKATPVGGDFIVIEDSAAANVKKHILISALPAQAADTLTATLAAGSLTGGTDVTVSSGDSIITPAGAGAGKGGDLPLVPGAGGATGGGGDVVITSGQGGATSGAAGDIILSTGTVVSGDIGVVRITNTALEFIEVASVPGPAIAATEGRLWIKSDTPNTAWFTDDAGTDHQLAAASGGGGTVLDANATSENVSCSRVAQTPTVDVAQPGQVNLGSESVASHGTTGAYGAILSGLNNYNQLPYSVVCGGENNDLTGPYTGSNYNALVGGTGNLITSVGAGGITVGAFLGGGTSNSIRGLLTNQTLQYSALVGGKNNYIETTSGSPCIVRQAFIGAGEGNYINSTGATLTNNSILGGENNYITGSLGTCDENVIGGGAPCYINCAVTVSSGTVKRNVIGGGQSNYMSNTGGSSDDLLANFIGAGNGNHILCTSTDTEYNGIVSGNGNEIGNAATSSFIGGGASNNIAADTCAIGGGSTNVISAGANFGAIPGGGNNTISAGTYSMAAGRQAKCAHGGVFLFADSTAADVASVEANQAHFGVANGVRISHTTEEDGFVTYVNEASTTDDTVTTLRTISLADNTAVLITARIVGMETDGSDRNAYILNALFYRDGGGATLQGSVDRAFEVESDAAWTADISASTNDVIVTVTGGPATTNVNWRTTVQVQQVS